MFLAYAIDFSDYLLYVLNGNLLWSIDINDNVIPSYPEKVSTFSPKELKMVSHVFKTHWMAIYLWSVTITST